MRAAAMACAVFRGSIAPASLKGGGAGHFKRGPARFPGLYCPGLIEGDRAPLVFDVGEPRFPGLYCPGLIEGGQDAFDIR